MDRDIVDIPEVFRKAFEDEGWDQGEGGDEGDGGGRGNGGGSRKPWWINRWLWIAALVLLLLLSFNWIINTYTEWLWFRALQYQNVWLTQWGIRLAVFAIAFVIAAAILLVNWRIAYRNAKRYRRLSRLPILDLPGINWLINGVALFLAFVFAGAAAAQWERLLLYANRQPFGVAEPIFNQDIGFYLFELPVYRFLQGWLLPLLIVTLIGTAALYLAESWATLQRGRWKPSFPQALRGHTAVLGTIIFAIWAIGLWLDIYELLYSSRGVVFGPTYTDLNATLPALYAQLAVMIVLVVVTAINIFRPFIRPLLVTGAIWLVIAIVAGNVYPALLQRYAVEPNELSRETPYIKHNIDFTRLAFGLDAVDARPFGQVQELTNLDLVENEATLRNVRLWDYRPLQQTYAQLQELRPYYEFSSIDIDRYNLDGNVRQVMLAGRELNKENLTAPSWVNQKLEFTHGYGMVMNPVDEVTPEGRPDFFIKDLPPASIIPLEVTRPEIYYGEMMTDVVFVGSGLDEFDYPLGTQNAYSSYAGKGGVELDSIWRRLAFSIRFGEINLLLSDYITPQTRVMLHRQVRDRVQQITPFLTFDNDPYLVLSDGRLIWMLDGYTLTNNFPYSTPTEQGFNYIRNAVKVTIDAYDGAVNYYVATPEDPIIRAYEQAFPSLFQPLEAMPEDLRAHIRYPEDLFTVQTRQYLKYHMTEVQVFYNQEDLWEIPLELFDNNQQPIEPYYVIMSLPDEEGTEFLLIQPYTPAGKNNMISWLAARNDPPNYGELVAYELSKQELVFGPIQVEARIDQDPQISAQISLWNQRGSRVIRGNLLVIPMNNSFLYVEPVYLLAESSELPELKRVIVASGDRIAMRETLGEAIIALIEQAPTVAEIVEEPPVSSTEGQTTSGEPGVTPTVGASVGAAPGATPPPATPETETGPTPETAATAVEELILSANAHLEAAETAQRQGQWAAYGRELELLRQDLEQLMQVAGQDN
jgi:uncharacterized membrane protein (UPF0182 family)